VRVDLADELRNVFLTHGAISVDSSALAPKPAPLSTFCTLALKRLHAPVLRCIGGLDISAAALEIAAPPVRELEACLSCSAVTDASLALNYARFCLPSPVDLPGALFLWLFLSSQGVGPLWSCGSAPF
jgi:hypothetical protein